MNYFAHGMPFIDQPYVLAGTAVPDWLSVADRKVRLRSRFVEPFLDHDDPVLSAVAAGTHRHHADDDRFHRSIAFYEVSGELTQRLRNVLGTDDGFRSGFLGHILTELLLDAVLIEQNPERLDDYYAAMNALDAQSIQTAVNLMAPRQTERLATFIEVFRREQFLRDYMTDAGLLYRLNQVMGRVGLPLLPNELQPVLRSARGIVRERCTDLFPPETELG